MVSMLVEFDGRIIRDTVATINSTFHFSTNNGVVFHSYIHQKNMINKTHYGTYSMNVQDGFTLNEESWILKTSNFCKKYIVEITIPEERKIVEAYILETNRVDNEPFSVLSTQGKTWVRVQTPSILLVSGINKTTIHVVLTRIKSSQMFKIMWKLEPIVSLPTNT